ncbi:MAG TPA: ribonuclease P protein component [Usitatibacter sp.]|nr:ribonuclease P protein component [Usitatibacter sp.]
MPRSARDEGFSRRHRFGTRGSFGPVLRAGKKVRGATLVIHALERRSPDSRLGIALTRRLAPSSVERNLLKRIVREAFRRHALKGGGLDCVVALRQRFEASSAGAVRGELSRLFDELHESRAR